MYVFIYVCMFVYVCKGKDLPEHAMEAKRRSRGMFHSFLTSTLLVDIGG
jgi:hypothetical protein